MQAATVGLDFAGRPAAAGRPSAFKARSARLGRLATNRTLEDGAGALAHHETHMQWHALGLRGAAQPRNEVRAGLFPHLADWQPHGGQRRMQVGREVVVVEADDRQRTGNLDGGAIERRQGASREVVVAAHHRSGPVGAVQVLDDLVHGRVALLEAVVGLDHGGLANRHAALGNFHREAVKAALRARVVAGAPADESKALVAQCREVRDHQRRSLSFAEADRMVHRFRGRPHQNEGYARGGEHG
ncbi:hypothetical protein D8B29_08960 [Verminephrobacter eiseniae]|nr:hypothetical protein [Verminephrobacter eiseniae]MCW5303994.1 hypothetical protein [Verminephrobacter eiseniae]MCW8179738.1 hypothetical protein [Verminephrobacter eiseniae]MCW8190361.1 hypothetical protein [Verminephrobacter eiseniae]